MAIKFTTPDDAHWYRVKPNKNTESLFSFSVEACHEEGLKGARKNGNIYPSFTSVEKVFGKDAIIKWKIGHYLNAAFNTPPIADESRETWAQRISELAEDAMSTGRTLGTRVHKAIEDGHTDDSEVAPILALAKDWIARNGLNVLFQEQRLYLPSLGLAGTCDIIMEDTQGGLVIGDWKTVKPYKGKLVLRESYVAQLSGYRQAIRETSTRLASKHIRCVSLLLNSQSPAIEAHWLDEEQLSEGYARLTAATFIWSQENKFWPLGRWRVLKHEEKESELTANLDIHGNPLLF